jgi:hypothetical protein
VHDELLGWDVSGPQAPFFGAATSFPDVIYRVVRRAVLFGHHLLESAALARLAKLRYMAGQGVYQERNPLFAAVYSVHPKCLPIQQGSQNRHAWRVAAVGHPWMIREARASTAPQCETLLNNVMSGRPA